MHGVPSMHRDLHPNHIPEAPDCLPPLAGNNCQPYTGNAHIRDMHPNRIPARGGYQACMGYQACIPARGPKVLDLAVQPATVADRQQARAWMTCIKPESGTVNQAQVKGP